MHSLEASSYSSGGNLNIWYALTCAIGTREAGGGAAVAGLHAHKPHLDMGRYIRYDSAGSATANITGLTAINFTIGTSVVAKTRHAWD